MKKIIAVPATLIIVILAITLPLTLGSAEVNVEYLESMRLDPPNDYIDELVSIVKENEDPYVRERAVFTLVDIAIEGNETEEIVDFLKELAMNETDDNVRTAAYANIPNRSVCKHRFNPGSVPPGEKRRHSLILFWGH
jgi:hypothetical protein